jgi:hypothetical protein
VLGAHRLQQGTRNDLYSLSDCHLDSHQFYRNGYMPDWVLLLLRERAFISAIRGNGDSIAPYRLQAGLFAFLPAPVRNAI